MEDLKKKIENIWYYNKIPIIVGLCFLALLISTVVNKLDEPKFDHSIAIISKYNYPSQENVNKLKSVFEKKFGGSFNVTIFNVELGAVGEREELISKLDLDLRQKISEYLFIENLDQFKKATSNIELDVALVSEVDWLSDLELDNFYYATRK